MIHNDTRTLIHPPLHLDIALIFPAPPFHQIWMHSFILPVSSFKSKFTFQLYQKLAKRKIERLLFRIGIGLKSTFCEFILHSDCTSNSDFPRIDKKFSPNFLSPVKQQSVERHRETWLQYFGQSLCISRGYFRTCKLSNCIAEIN